MLEAFEPAPRKEAVLGDDVNALLDNLKNKAESLIMNFTKWANFSHNFKHSDVTKCN